MTTIRCNQFNSHQNECFEDEEDSLSLCDLPINNHETDTNPNTEPNDQEHYFEFSSFRCHSPENICSADEVFFQGQILPLLHSVSSKENDPRSNGYRYKPKIRNQFHSHPSPTPQIRTKSFRTFSQSKPKPKTTSLWSFLQVGVAKPQEIGLSDLKTRSKRFGSYNSNGSSSSSSRNSRKDENQNQNQNQKKKKMKMKKKKKQRLLLGGCKCSLDSVEGCTVKEKEAVTRKEENMLHVRNLVVSEEERRVVGGRRRYRTFEWLKQLSVSEA